MAKNYSEVEIFLNQEIHNVSLSLKKNINEFIEPKGVRKAIRDILSLPPSMKLPGSIQEHEIFEKIVLLMSIKSRKWLSEAQVAFPYKEMLLSKDVTDAELKSRVWDREIYELEDEIKKQRLIAIGDHLILREYFMNLLDKCILDDERKKYPHLLTLVNTTPENLNEQGEIKSGIDASAWYLFRYCNEVIRSLEKNSRIMPKTQDINELLDDNNATEQNAKQLHLFQSKVDDGPWKKWMKLTTPSQDSLFARLFVHACLNRMMLEIWAFERRSKQALLIQEAMVKKLETTIPKGIVPLLKQHTKTGSLDHKGFIQDAFDLHTSDEVNLLKTLTPNVLERINEQVKAVMESSLSNEFSGEVEVNLIMNKLSVPAQALLWLGFTWSYFHNSKLVNDDPRIHSPELAPISRRSKLVQDGQGMVTLRRFLVTLLNSYQWYSPSVKRLLQHESYFSTVRRRILRVFEQDFKPTTLAEWGWPAYVDSYPMK